MVEYSDVSQQSMVPVRLYLRGFDTTVLHVLPIPGVAGTKCGYSRCKMPYRKSRNGKAYSIPAIYKNISSATVRKALCVLAGGTDTASVLLVLASAVKARLPSVSQTGL